MSDFFTDNQNENPSADAKETEEFSTVFSNPTEHKAVNVKNKNKKRIVTVVSVFLAVAVVLSGTIAVIKLIPEKEDKDTSSTSSVASVSALSVDADNLSSAEITNQNGTFNFYCEKTEDQNSDSSESSVKTTWYAEGVDKELSSSTVIASKISSASSIEAIMKIDNLSDEICGLNEPKFKIILNHSDDNKTNEITVGGASADSMGIYVKVDKQIYLVDSSFADAFDFDLLDLGKTDSIPAAFTSSGDNEQITLKYIDISGKHFANPVRIEENTQEELSSVVAYVVTQPIYRAADNITGISGLFTSDISVSGLYAYDVSPTSLALVHLDDPDIIVTAGYGDKEKTYKISVVDDNYCAIITDDSKVISKIVKSSLDFADFDSSSFYSKIVCMEMLNSLSNFKIESSEGIFDFDIKYDEEADESFTIFANKKEIVASDFQTFYQEFVSLSSNDFSTNNLTSSPDIIITLTHSADNSKTVLEFRKVSEIKYEYSVNGLPLGKVSSTNINKLVKDAKKLVK